MASTHMYICASTHIGTNRKQRSEPMWRVRVFSAFNQLIPSLFGVQKPRGDRGDNVEVVSGPQLRRDVIQSLCPWLQPVLPVDSLILEHLLRPSVSSQVMPFLLHQYLSIAFLIDWFYDSPSIILCHLLCALLVLRTEPGDLYTLHKCSTFEPHYQPEVAFLKTQFYSAANGLGRVREDGLL